MQLPSQAAQLLSMRRPGTVARGPATGGTTVDASGWRCRLFLGKRACPNSTEPSVFVRFATRRDYLEMTPAERLSIIEQRTLDSWVFREKPMAESSAPTGGTLERTALRAPALW